MKNTPPSPVQQIIPKRYKDNATCSTYAFSHWQCADYRSPFGMICSNLNFEHTTMYDLLWFGEIFSTIYYSVYVKNALGKLHESEVFFALYFIYHKQIKKQIKGFVCDCNLICLYT